MKYDPFRSSDEGIPVYRNSLIKIRPSKHIICDHKVWEIMDNNKHN